MHQEEWYHEDYLPVSLTGGGEFLFYAAELLKGKENGEH